jgi:hypothetical protein
VVEPITTHGDILTMRTQLESIRYVRVISRKALREPLDDWYRTAKRLRWTGLVDVYPHADVAGEFTILNRKDWKKR